MNMKYTVIWNETWMSGSSLHTLTKMTRFVDTPIKKIMKSNYGERAVYIFEGHPYLVGMNHLESEPIKID